MLSLLFKLLRLVRVCYAGKRNFYKQASTIGLERMMSNRVSERKIKRLLVLDHAYHFYMDSTQIKTFELNW